MRGRTSIHRRPGHTLATGIGIVIVVGFSAALAATVAAHAAVAGPAGHPCGVKSKPPTTFDHVIWIWMENHSYDEILGSRSTPYLHSLVRACGLATNYRAVSHPSLPNYIAATSGSTWGIGDDDPPSSHRLAVASIFQQARSAGSYEESMPSNCALSNSGAYAVRHNPEAYYTPIRPACGNKDVPLRTGTGGAFMNALDTVSLPAFSLVTPNTCNDMHDCSIRTGDRWLSNWVPRITRSATYRAGKTVLFITWDENDGSSGNQVATIVVSPYTAPGVKSGQRFSHYSLLRTTEDLLGLHTHLGLAAQALSMRSAFDL
jgi:hypothetical protein